MNCGAKPGLEFKGHIPSARTWQLRNAGKEQSWPGAVGLCAPKTGPVPKERMKDGAGAVGTELRAPCGPARAPC